MTFQLDRTKTYALALEGGGGRGAYEIGAWQAMRDEGIRFSAVAGTSVGSINGAAIAAGDADRAAELWKKLTYSQVMDVDDDFMSRLIRLDIDRDSIAETAKALTETVKNGGFDITPLKATLLEGIDEKAVMESPMEFYIVTFSISDRKEVVVRAKDLAPGELYDMILASSYLPVFRAEKLRGKRYFDGGITNRLPVKPLAERGYMDIIAVKLNSIGPIQKYDIPGVEVHSVDPQVDLGNLMQFEPELSERNLKLGYYDAVRMMYGLTGRSYYIDRQMTEDEAYTVLHRFASSYARATGTACDRRTVNEKMLPAVASRLKVRRTDGYYDLLLAVLESAASAAGIDPFRVFTEQELIARLLKVYDPASGNIPGTLLKAVPSAQKR